MIAAARRLQPLTARIAGAAVLLVMVLPTLLAAADTDEAAQRLRAAIAEAQAQRAEIAATIEQQRADRLAAIDTAQATVRTLRSSVEDLRGQRQQLEEERRRLQERARGDAAALRRRIARLAGEVPEQVRPGDTPTALVRRWPRITAAVDERVAALAADCRTSREERTIMDRSGEAATAPVWHWGAAQRIALGDNAALRGLLTRVGDDEWMVAGPVPPAALAAPPVDVTGTLTTLRPTDDSLAATIDRAGPFAWPLLAVALLGLWLIGDRLWLLWRWHAPRDLADQLIADIDSGGSKRATDRLEHRRHAPQTRVLRSILTGEDATTAERTQRAGAALVEAEVRLQRGLRLLAVLAAAAPLLGLLGTVTGMITSFRALDIGGSGNAEQLSAGIGEALLTTEIGLIVAVPLLLAHAVFSRDAQRRHAHAESAAMQVLAHLERPRDEALEARDE